MKHNQTPKDRIKSNNLSLPNHKFKKNTNTNKRYQNMPKIQLNPTNSGISNNNLIYQSYNTKGYNGLIDPSLAGNNNFLFIKNTSFNPYQSQNNDIKAKKSFIKTIKNKNENSKSQLLKTSHPQIPKKVENKRYFDANKLLQTESKWSLSKKNIQNENLLNWNNIGFKEVKYQKNFEKSTFDINNKNNNLLKSYQPFPKMNNYYKPSADNLGFFNDNLCSSYNPNYEIGNYYNFKQKINPISNSEIIRQKKYSNFPLNFNNKNGSKELLKINDKDKLIYYNNQPSNLRSIDIDNENKVIPIIKNDIILKKNNINNINNDFIPKNHLIISYNRNLKNKDKKNLYSSQINKNNINNKKSLTESQDIEKYRTPNNNFKKNMFSLYEYYKDAIKKPKAYNQLEGNYLAKNRKNDKYFNNEENIQKICKIQSIWRGGYVRELMSYYWSLSKFKDLLELILINHSKKQFLNNMKKLKENNLMKENNIDIKYNMKESINDLNKILKNNEFDIEKLKINLTKKEEDYEKLLKDYNDIVNQYSELKKSNEENNNIIKENKNNNEEEIPSNFTIDNNNFEILNNKKIVKKFENNIKKEKKEELNIISNNNNNQSKLNNENNTNTSIRLRAKFPKKENKNKIQITNSDILLKNENNDKKDYNDYLNHFKSNLNIINTENIDFLINPIIKENNLTKYKYEILNFNFSLINNKTSPKLNKICNNDQLSIINNYQNILLDNDSAYKSNNNENNEVTTIASGKDIKDNKFNLITEKQIDLNTELKGNENAVISPTNEYFIEEQNNINILNIPKINEFNKDLLLVKNDILFSIINQNKNDNIIEEDIEKIIGNKCKDTLDSENYNNLENENNLDNNKTLLRNNNINIFENERFYLINNTNNKKSKKENINSLIEKKEIEFNMDLRSYFYYNENLRIFNNDNIFIKCENKKCDKTTEISEEINKIEPSNPTELIFQGINTKKDILNENGINIINEQDNIVNNNENNNKINLKENKKILLDNEISNNINLNFEKKNNKNINYNEINEIEKGEGIEINPYEIKRTQNNINNTFISYENRIQMLNDKNALYIEKAKKNIVKIIFPIKIKTFLKEWIKKNVYKVLINNLKKICFISHLMMINNNYMNKNKKNSFEKIKENSKMIQLKNYYLNEFRKSMIKNLFRKYAIYKWNIELNNLAKLIIFNKSLIIKNNK